MQPWTKGKGKRCEDRTQGSGAGYKGPHQCSFTAAIEYNGRMLCMTHVRARLKRRKKNRG